MGTKFRDDSSPILFRISKWFATIFSRPFLMIFRDNSTYSSRGLSKINIKVNWFGSQLFGVLLDRMSRIKQSSTPDLCSSLGYEDDKKIWIPLLLLITVYVINASKVECNYTHLFYEQISEIAKWIRQIDLASRLSKVVTYQNVRITWSELAMEDPGLVMHFRKHLSVTFCRGKKIIQWLKCVFIWVL